MSGTVYESLPPRIHGTVQGYISIRPLKLKFNDNSLASGHKVRFQWWGAQNTFPIELIIPWKGLNQDEAIFPIRVDKTSIESYLLDMEKLVFTIYQADEKVIGKSHLDLKALIENNLLFDGYLPVNGTSSKKKDVGSLHIQFTTSIDSIEKIIKSKSSTLDSFQKVEALVTSDMSQKFSMWPSDVAKSPVPFRSSMNLNETKTTQKSPRKLEDINHLDSIEHKAKLKNQAGKHILPTSACASISTHEVLQNIPIVDSNTAGSTSRVHVKNDSLMDAAREIKVDVDDAIKPTLHLKEPPPPDILNTALKRAEELLKKVKHVSPSMNVSYSKDIADKVRKPNDKNSTPSFASSFHIDQTVSDFISQRSQVDWLLRGVPEAFDDGTMIDDEVVDSLIKEGGLPPSQVAFPSLYASTQYTLDHLRHAKMLKLRMLKMHVYSTKCGVRKDSAFLVVHCPIGCSFMANSSKVKSLIMELAPHISPKNGDTSRTKLADKKDAPSGLKSYFVGSCQINIEVDIQLELNDTVISEWIRPAASASNAIRVDLYSPLFPTMIAKKSAYSRNSNSKKNITTPDNHPLLLASATIPLSSLLGLKEMSSHVHSDLVLNQTSHAAVVSRMEKLLSSKSVKPATSSALGNNLGSLTTHLQLLTDIDTSYSFDAHSRSKSNQANDANAAIYFPTENSSLAREDNNGSRILKTRLDEALSYVPTEASGDAAIPYPMPSKMQWFQVPGQSSVSCTSNDMSSSQQKSYFVIAIHEVLLSSISENKNLSTERQSVLGRLPDFLLCTNMNVVCKCALNFTSIRDEVTSIVPSIPLAKQTISKNQSYPLAFDSGSVHGIGNLLSGWRGGIYFELWADWTNFSHPHSTNLKALLALAKFPHLTEFDRVVDLELIDPTTGHIVGFISVTLRIENESMTAQRSLKTVIDNYRLHKDMFQEPMDIEGPRPSVNTSITIDDEANANTSETSSAVGGIEEYDDSERDSLDGENLHRNYISPHKSDVDPSPSPHPRTSRAGQAINYFNLSASEQSTDSLLPLKSVRSIDANRNGSISDKIAADSLDFAGSSILKSSITSETKELRQDDIDAFIQNSVGDIKREYIPVTPVELTHILDLSVEGCFDEVTQWVDTSQQGAGDMNASILTSLGCFICYALPGLDFQNCSHHNSIRIAHHNESNTSRDFFSVWWDKECSILNSFNRHKFTTSGGTDILRHLGLDNNAPVLEFSLVPSNIDGVMISNPIAIGAAYLMISDLIDVVSRSGCNRVVSLPIQFSSEFSRHFSVMSPIYLRVVLSHRILPTLSSSFDKNIRSVPNQTKMPHPSPHLMDNESNIFSDASNVEVDKESLRQPNVASMVSVVDHVHCNVNCLDANQLRSVVSVNAIAHLQMSSDVKDASISSYMHQHSSIGCDYTVYVVCTCYPAMTAIARSGKIEHQNEKFSTSAKNYNFKFITYNESYEAIIDFPHAISSNATPTESLKFFKGMEMVFSIYAKPIWILPHLDRDTSVPSKIQIGDILIGTTCVDLSPLAAGFPCIEGWYHINNEAKHSCGQIQITVNFDPEPSTEEPYSVSIELEESVHDLDINIHDFVSNIIPDEEVSMTSELTKLINRLDSSNQRLLASINIIQSSSAESKRNDANYEGDNDYGDRESIVSMESIHTSSQASEDFSVERKDVFDDIRSISFLVGDDVKSEVAEDEDTLIPLRSEDGQSQGPVCGYSLYEYQSEDGDGQEEEEREVGEGKSRVVKMNLYDSVDSPSMSLADSAVDYFDHSDNDRDDEKDDSFGVGEYTEAGWNKSEKDKHSSNFSGIDSIYDVEDNLPRDDKYLDTDAPREVQKDLGHNDIDFQSYKMDVNGLHSDSLYDESSNEEVDSHRDYTAQLSEENIFYDKTVKDLHEICDSNSSVSDGDGDGDGDENSDNSQSNEHNYSADISQKNSYLNSAQESNNQSTLDVLIRGADVADTNAGTEVSIEPLLDIDGYQDQSSGMDEQATAPNIMDVSKDGDDDMTNPNTVDEEGTRATPQHLQAPLCASILPTISINRNDDDLCHASALEILGEVDESDHLSYVEKSKSVEMEDRNLYSLHKNEMNVSLNTNGKHSNHPPTDEVKLFASDVGLVGDFDIPSGTLRVTANTLNKSDLSRNRNLMETVAQVNRGDFTPDAEHFYVSTKSCDHDKYIHKDTSTTSSGYEPIMGIVQNVMKNYSNMGNRIAQYPGQRRRFVDVETDRISRIMMGKLPSPSTTRHCG